jgi:hypothetical protein
MTSHLSSFLLRPPLPRPFGISKSNSEINQQETNRNTNQVSESTLANTHLHRQRLATREKLYDTDHPRCTERESLNSFKGTWTTSTPQLHPPHLSTWENEAPVYVRYSRSYHIYTYTHVHTHTYIHTYIYKYTYICYIYYVHTCIYTYIT